MQELQVAAFCLGLVCWRGASRRGLFPYPFRHGWTEASDFLLAIEAEKLKLVRLDLANLSWGSANTCLVRGRAGFAITRENDIRHFPYAASLTLGRIAAGALDPDEQAPSG